MNIGFDLNYYVKICRYRICILLHIFLLVSCVAVQPFPYIVRAGDTITLAIGSLDGVNRNNITIEYYPDSDPLNPVNITPGLRSVLRVYPDKTSQAYWDKGEFVGVDTIEYQTTLSAHGPWQTVAVIDLPGTLPAGTGHIEVSLSSEVVYPLTLKKADDINIPIEILGNNGSAHVFEYHKGFFNNDTTIGDLTKLEQLRQVVIRVLPNLTANYTPVYAAEYVLTVPIWDQQSNDVSNQVINSDIAIVFDDQPNYIRNQTNLFWSRSGETFTVIVISAGGDQDPSNLRFSILISNPEISTVNNWEISDNVSLVSVNYYDAVGELVTGPVPQAIIQN